MSDDCPRHKKQDPGAPAWVMTFADLMSLLMCFFVLLFSFSEMDVSKYKQIAGSMRDAFGVQREVKVKESPKGINIIAREFSPGRPQPTPLNIVRQNTMKDMQRFLDMGKDRTRNDRGGPGGESVQQDGKDAMKDAMKDMPGRAKEDMSDADLKASEEQMRALEQQMLQALKTQRDMKDIREALKDEINNGEVDVELIDKNIVIRIREKASFASGRAELRKDFKPILVRVGAILEEKDGQIVVAGHTDNVPINTRRFRSNWELSAARAVTVVHALLAESNVPAGRFQVEGHAETRPIASNDTWQERALNRRVEVTLKRDDGFPDAGQELDAAAPMDAIPAIDTPLLDSTAVPDGQ